MFTDISNNTESVDVSTSSSAPAYTSQTEIENYSAMDFLLEKEKSHNKTETWNKLNKTIKIQKLHMFAEKYGKDNTLPIKDVKSLKLFFIDSLNKSKLQKTKDVVYDKEKGVIQSIPALHFHTTNRTFTLKIMDNKRVSTIKSLTPRKTIQDTATATATACTL
jgi:hypothetical protein